MSKTKVEWTETTWNPITGCTPVSDGCLNCYAARKAKRLRGRVGYPSGDPFRVTLHMNRFNEPLSWRKPRNVFVFPMGDLFHKDVPTWALDWLFDRVIDVTPEHTYQILTKRPERMRDYTKQRWGTKYMARLRGSEERMAALNVWAGVSAENQKCFDERVLVLLETFAAVRFVSLEPLLGPIDISGALGRYKSLDWVIVGAETGPGKRPMELDWARSIRDQCQEAGVPFFFKKDSNGSRLLDGQEWNERPELGRER